MSIICSTEKSMDRNPPGIVHNSYYLFHIPLTVLSIEKREQTAPYAGLAFNIWITQWIVYNENEA